MTGFIGAAQDWCPWCGQHMNRGGWTTMILVWLIVIVAVVALIWAVARGRSSSVGGSAGRDPAEDALRQQFARGEIDEDTYRRRLD